MATFTRRAFVVGGLAVGTALPAVAADPDDKTEEPWIEFDGKPQHNPKGVGGGKVKGTGIIRPPAGYKVHEILIRWQPAGNASGLWTTTKATVDETKSPPTWSFTTDPQDVGEYWFEALVRFDAPNGERKAQDSLDRRRVWAKK